MKGNLWAIVVVFVFLALMLPAVSLGFEGATTPNDVSAEEIVLEHEQPVPVEYADKAVDDPDTVTVIDENGDELETFEDYDWQNGNITALDPSLDQETVFVDYVYLTRTEETESAGQILSVFDSWIAILTLFVALGAVWAWTKMGGSY